MKGETLKISLTFLSLIIIFIIDLFIPLGVAVGILYVTSVFGLLTLSRLNIHYYFSLICTILIVSALLINIDDSTSWKAIINRGISIAAIWVITFVIVYYKKSISFKEATILKNQAKLEEINESLANKNKELEQFAYIASHDLQEPLRTISSFSGILNETYYDQIDEIGQKSLDFISDSSDRMSALIKGLLDYSRIGKEKKIELIDTQQLITEIQEDLGQAIQEKNVILRYSDLPKINAVHTDIRLLFQNLISNGIKFSKEDVQPEIEIKCSELEKFWEFSVADNGIGIDEKYFEKIFIIFQRLHAKTEFEGTGIGLSHCQKIVREHGGEIWVNSKVNEGSTFKFTLYKGNSIA